MVGITMDGEVTTITVLIAITDTDQVGDTMDTKTIVGVIMVTHITKGLEMEYTLQMETTETAITVQVTMEEEEVEELEQDHHLLMEIEDQILEQVIRLELAKTQMYSQEDNL